MEMPRKTLKQLFFITKAKIKENMLIVMDNSTLEKIYLIHYKLLINNSKSMSPF